MEAGSNMSEPNSPEESQHLESQEESSNDGSETFVPPNDEDATVQTANRENERFHPRHPDELSTSYFRPPMEWRPPPRPYHSHWHPYSPRAYIPPPPARPLREGDIFQPFAARPTSSAHQPVEAYHHQLNHEPEEPISPPDYRSSFFHQGHHFGIPRQLRWPELSPHGSNLQRHAYAYHPSVHIMALQGNTDNSQGSRTPSFDQDHIGSPEFSGRRFIPTDIPPPPAVYIPPQQPARSPPLLPPLPSPPPPPPAPSQPPTRAPAKAPSGGPESPGVKKRKALHPGSQGVYINDTFDCDILCGRGVPTREQWGNKLFKQLVRERQMEYLACERNDKSRLANEIIDIIRSHNGRFLRRVKVPDRRERFSWVELTTQRAYEKVCQALRDGGPRIRQAMKALTDEEHGRRDYVEKENFENGPEAYGV